MKHTRSPRKYYRFYDFKNRENRRNVPGCPTIIIIKKQQFNTNNNNNNNNKNNKLSLRRGVTSRTSLQLRLATTVCGMFFIFVPVITLSQISRPMSLSHHLYDHVRCIYGFGSVCKADGRGNEITQVLTETPRWWTIAWRLMIHVYMYIYMCLYINM